MLTQSDIRQVLWFTTWQALVSTALTLVIALPGAYALARFDFPGKQVLRAVITVPFVLPTVVVGTAFMALVGRGGLLDALWGVRLDTTVWAILLAHVFFNYAVVVRTVGGLWAQLDPRQEEAARMLRASRFTAWRTVTLPALAPAVAAAALMVFLFTFTSFGVVQILGGPTFSTLEVEIYRQTADLFDLSTAAVLTLIQFVAVGAILALHAWTVRRRETALRLVDASVTARRPRGAGQWALLAGVVATVVVLLLLPLAVLVQRSFGGAGPRLLPRTDRGGRRGLPGRPDRGDRQLAELRRRRHRDRRGDRRSRRRRADPARRGTAGARLRRAADAAARRLRRDRRLRFPHRPRRTPAGPARLLDPGAARAGAGRRALRRTDHAAGAAGGGRAAAGGGLGAGRVAVAGMARGGPAAGAAGAADRRRVRLRRVPGGVRRDGVHRAARQPDPAGGRGAAAGTARGPQLRAGDGPVDDSDDRVRRGSAGAGAAADRPDGEF